MSYININNLLDLYFNYSNIKPIDKIKKEILLNKKEYLSNKNINLPDVITSGKDLFIQIINDPKINFISNKTISSKILDFKTSSSCREIPISFTDVPNEKVSFIFSCLVNHKTISLTEVDLISGPFVELNISLEGLQIPNFLFLIIHSNSVRVSTTWHFSFRLAKSQAF